MSDAVRSIAIVTIPDSPLGWYMTVILPLAFTHRPSIPSVSASETAMSNVQVACITLVRAVRVCSLLLLRPTVAPNPKLARQARPTAS